MTTIITKYLYSQQQQQQQQQQNTTEYKTRYK